MFTIRYPGSLAPDCNNYWEFKAYSIGMFEPATLEEMKQISTYLPVCLWKICVDGYRDTTYLDDKSYVITPDGIKYEYHEFSKLAKVLNNMNIEQALEAL